MMLRGSLKARRQAILKDCRLQSDEEFRTVLYSRSPKIRFHDLRHSAATLLLAQGVSPRYVSELLAHSSVSFTLHTYAHVLEQTKREVAMRMDTILNLVATSEATDSGASPLKRPVSN